MAKIQVNMGNMAMVVRDLKGGQAKELIGMIGDKAEIVSVKAETISLIPRVQQLRELIILVSTFTTKKRR